MENKIWFFFLLYLGQITSGSSQQRDIQDYVQEIPNSSLIIDMAAIPAGSFMMGSPDDEKKRLSDEGPVHSVVLDAFWISKYEITWDLYYEYLHDDLKGKERTAGEENTSSLVDAVSGATIPYMDMSLGMGTGTGLPVGNVTWEAASDFCRWLSVKTGNFYRLPTEAEWEYAVRAGTETAYYFGDDPGDLVDHAWLFVNSEESYQKVGQKKPNPWGLYDMYGNVSEWTLTTYSPDSYKKNRERNKRNPCETPVQEYPHVVRGGAYKDEAGKLRSASRFSSKEKWKIRDPQFPKSRWWNTDAPFVGFRIVRPKCDLERNNSKKD